MDDKEKKKVGSALFEKYINKGQSVVDKAASSSVNRESSDWAKTAREAIRTGFDGGYVDFEEALAKGQTNIDPRTYARATDGKEEASGKPKPKRFIRDIDDRIARAKQQVKEEKDAGIDKDRNYRDAKIAEKEKLIRDTMDKRGTNTISTKAFGYDVGLVRTGERGEFSIGENGQPMFSEHKDSYEREDGTIVAGSAKAVPEPAELTINGKPVVVKPSLTGDAVSFEGRYPEISQDLAREGIAKMAADGTTKWAKEVGEGDAKHTVEVAMKGSAGRTQVVVDKSLKGDQTARAGGTRVSGGFFDMAEKSMSDNGTYDYATTMPDGKSVTCGIHVKVNGKPAMIDGWDGKDSRNLKDGQTTQISGSRVSEGFWDMAKGNMSVNGTYNYATTMPDGKTVTCGIHVRVNGKPAMIDGWGGRDAMGEESIPSDKFQHALNQMKEHGTQSWAETLQDGTTIQVGISTQIDGDKRTALDWGNSKIEAVVEPEKTVISMETYHRALNQMKEHGAQDWAETLQDGTTIQVGISAQVDGDRRTTLDWSNDKIEATVGPEKILVSKDTMMEAAENMLAGEGGKRSFEKTLADGTTVEFRMGARIDGRGAVIEENFDGREVCEERDRVLVGKDIFKDATGEMSAKQSIAAKALDRNGNEVEFKRPGKIRMFVNGQEMNDDQYEEALAEVAGVNDGKTFAGFAKAAGNVKEQGLIQIERSLVSAGMTAPVRAVKEGRQKNASLLSQLLSMLFNTISRTSQSIGR